MNAIYFLSTVYVAIKVKFHDKDKFSSLGFTIKVTL